VDLKSSINLMMEIFLKQDIMCRKRNQNLRIKFLKLVLMIT